MKFNGTKVKFLALILCAAMMLPALVGCSIFKEIDKDYTGPTFNVYLADAPTNFDPMYAYLDDSAAQMLSLIYEGLFKYDENGKVVKGLCDSYEWVVNDDSTGEYILEIEIIDTVWSDNVTVTANDFVYAWRRILDPGNHSDVASLLYDIKNAAQVKSGDLETFDLGAYAVGNTTIRIEFAHKVNLDIFFANLASPALVPMRHDVVDKVDDWSSCSAIVVSNGPFYLKTFKWGDMLRFERNRNYRRDLENDEMWEYVTPYRIIMWIGEKYTPEDAPDDFKAFSFKNVQELNKYLYDEGELDYYSHVGLANSSLASDSGFKKLSKQSTHAYYFNTNNELFKDARVRRALSMAIDRSDLVSKATVNGTPAKGLITDGVFDAGYGKNAKTFRSVVGDLIGGAKLDEAKALLKEAGVTRGSFSITVREYDEIALATAEYVKAVWEELGFTVRIDKEDASKYNNTKMGFDNLVEDDFLEAYKTGDFDVIAIDYQQLTTDAFSALAPFSTEFCGGSINLEEQQDEYAVFHKTGYASEAYDELIKKAYDETDLAKRADYLHQAEKLLMEDMPVIPLFTFGTVYTTSSTTKGIEFDWFGNAIFTEADDKDYKYDKENP